MRLDFVTIGYGGDLRLLRLQARSVGRYLDPASVAAVTVVNNEPDRAGFRAAFGAEVLPGYGALRPLVRLVDADELLPGGARWSGYRRQQALKLLAHRIAASPCYVTLDAKNLFVRRAGWRYFFDALGRNILRHRRLSDHLTGALRLFGADPAAWPEAVPDIYTPFGLWRDACAGLEAHVADRLGTDPGRLLCEVATHEGRPLYEYLLYSAWWHAVGGGIERQHRLDRRPLSLTWLANDPRLGPEVILDHVEDERVRMIGLHRRIEAAPAPARAALAALLLRFGLVATVEEGMAALSAA